MSTPPENRLNYRRQPDNPDELTVSPTKAAVEAAKAKAREAEAKTAQQAA
jgi:hypothetical protein